MKARLAWRSWILVCFLCFVPARPGIALPRSDDQALVGAMQQELKRAHESLGKLDPAPYFLSYSVYDQNSAFAVATQGSLLSSARAHHRGAEVIVRIGTPVLDNAHEQSRYSAISSGVL